MAQDECFQSIFVNVGYFPQLVIVHSCETSLRQIYSSFCGTSACVGDDRCGEVTDGPWGVWGGTTPAGGGGFLWELLGLL